MRSSLFTPLTFDLTINRPLRDCLDQLQTENERLAPWLRYNVNINGSDGRLLAFSLIKERRTIPIHVNGYFEVLTDSSTRLVGEIRAIFSPLILILCFCLIIVLIVLTTQPAPGSLCFAGLGCFILTIGAIMELVTYHYARLSVFTFIKRLSN